MSSLSSGSTQGRRYSVPIAALVLTMLGWPSGAGVAFAHEFRLALVTPTSRSAQAELRGIDVRDGFRLAVDQSPDVSHAPGADAGDHLGGLDVDVSVIDGTDAASAAEAVRQQIATGLTILVVIAPNATGRAVWAEAAESPVLVLMAEGAGADAPADAGALRLTQHLEPPATSAAAAEFTETFGRRHGRDPSAAAALGYDAGRLLDIAIARASDGVEDVESVIAVATEPDVVLVSSSAAASNRATSKESPTGLPKVPTETRTDRGRLIVAVGAGVLLSIVAVVVRLQHRRRRGH